MGSPPERRAAFAFTPLLVAPDLFGVLFFLAFQSLQVVFKVIEKAHVGLSAEFLLNLICQVIAL
jgi:hypothetical protein